jgi:transcriptional regulator with XRE-family HTH domain
MTASRAGSRESFAERLRLLVEKNAGGNIRAAAQFLGISPPSLHALVNGESRPRQATLDRIADKYGVTRAWLLEGTGQGPSTDALDPASYSRETMQWEELLQGLDLTSEELSVMRQLPTTMHTIAARFIVAPRLARGPSNIDAIDQIRRAYGGEVSRAIREERGAWVRLLREWIATEGPKEVSAVIRHHVDDFHSHFVLEGVHTTQPKQPVAREWPASRKR